MRDLEHDILSMLAIELRRLSPALARSGYAYTDALRRENKMAQDAATQAGLDREQRRILHDEISGQGISDFQEILRIAEDIKAGRY